MTPDVVAVEVDGGGCGGGRPTIAGDASGSTQEAISFRLLTLASPRSQTGLIVEIFKGLAGLLGLQQREVRIEIERFLRNSRALSLSPRPAWIRPA